MSDDANQDLNATSPAKPWPRAVAWLAVVAHISVTAALWQAPDAVYSLTVPYAEISSSLLLAQVNLLTLWLIVGCGPAIRRIAWTVCGWSGIAFALATGATLQSDALFAYAVQVPVMASLVATLWFRGRKVIWLAAEPARCDEPRYRDRQFSILDLFSAALAIAIAAALLTRIDLVATFPPPRLAEFIQTTLAVSLPAAAMTLVSILGLRGDAVLNMQMVLASMALLLGMGLKTDQRGEWDGLFEIHAAHWLVVAATLWIFGMCGYRLAGTKELRSADH
jgi:hypothetical protein